MVDVPTIYSDDPTNRLADVDVASHKLIINACDWQIGEKAAAIELTKGGDYNTQIAADCIGHSVD